MTTLSAALGRATSILEDAEKPEARLEAEVLLMHLLGLSRVQLYSRWTEPLNAAHESTLEELVARRQSGEPLAYITGHREFFGLDLAVDRRVLIPRPETELLVESALSWLNARPGVPKLIADVGTGSGAIAVSLAFHCPDAVVYATDISAEALSVAQLGAYDRFSIERGLEAAQREAHFKQNQSFWIIDPALKRIVQFRRFNLLESLAPLGVFDCVFLRNVAIYFSLQTKVDLIRCIRASMTASGVFFLGSTESLSFLQHDFLVREHGKHVYYEVPG